MCVQHGLKFMYKPVGSCHMYCTCCSITLHSKLYMFSLFILIIVNVIVFILFYLQVEPVFLPACLNKAIQITLVSSISATVSPMSINCPCKSSQNRCEKCRRSPDIVMEKCCVAGLI